VDGPVFRGEQVRFDDVGTIPFDAFGAPGWEPRAQRAAAAQGRAGRPPDAGAATDGMAASDGAAVMAGRAGDAGSLLVGDVPAAGWPDGRKPATGQSGQSAADGPDGHPAGIRQKGRAAGAGQVGARGGGARGRSARRQGHGG
jgi:hypothetical protein